MTSYLQAIQPYLQKIRHYRVQLLLSALFCILAALFLWLKELDEKVVAGMSGQQWPLPARVYARPLELFAGLDIRKDDIAAELKMLGYQETELAAAGSFSSTPDGLIIRTRGFRFTDKAEAASEVTVSFSGEKIDSMTHDDTTRSLLRLEPLEIGSIHPGLHEDRMLVTLDELPSGFVDALIAVEDRGFHSHAGISLKGILRAIWVNLKSGSKRQGASTLTQQLVKNLYLNSQKTWQRKITEMFMALVMEFRYDKDTILETFINEVFIAQDGSRAIHGFGLASHYFFDRPVKELLPHDYALLIGMLKAPSRYNPIRHPERSTERRNLVLAVMEEQGHLSAREKEIAEAHPLTLSSGNSGGNPAYLDVVRRQLINDYALEDLQSSGLSIFTSYDPILQKIAEQSMETSFAQLGERFNEQVTNDFLEAAMVLTEPNTGEVKAIIGGRDSRLAGFNRALDARRPVGSLLKPAIFLTALQDESSYTLATPVIDEPISLEQPDGSNWAPENFDGKTYGPVIAIEALSRSLNLASINLGFELGMPAVIETLKSLGISTDLPELPSLFVGAQEFSVLEVTQIYQTIAAGGFTTPLRTIREVVKQNGDTLKQYSIDVSQKFDPETIYLLKYALATSMLSGTGRSVTDSLADGFNVAGKTGTSDEQRDSWFAGFSEDYLAVVWVGNDENKKTPLTGSSGALKLWSGLFGEIARRSLDLSPPSTVSFYSIDTETGHRVPTGCNAGIQIPFIEGSQPTTTVRCPSTPTLVEWFRSLIR